MAAEQKRFWERWREAWQRWMERRREEQTRMISDQEAREKAAKDEIRKIVEEAGKRADQEEAQKFKEEMARREKEWWERRMEELERSPEHDRYLELLEDKEFGRKMVDLYWEIKVERELTGGREEDIRDNRLWEMGFSRHSPEWDAAVELINRENDEHYTAFAELRGDPSAAPEDWKFAEEWEKKNLLNALNRLEKHMEKELKSEVPGMERIKLFRQGAYVIGNVNGKKTVGFAPYKDYQLKIEKIQWAYNPNLEFSLWKDRKGYYIKMSGEMNGKGYFKEAKPFHELNWEIEQKKERFQQKQQETVMERGLER